MESEAEPDAQTAADVGSPADFLVNLGNVLREKEHVDLGLADLLAEHLLTATPAVDAVAKAKDAIVKLAVARADPPKSEVSDG